MDANKYILLSNLLNAELEKYKSLSRNDLINSLNIDHKCKNINRMVFTHIINSSKNKDKINALFSELSCVVKTINLEWNLSLKESMSLNVFKYNDLYVETWDNSTLRNYFDTTTFVFVAFKKFKNDCSLYKICVWKMPKMILDKGVYETWEKTKEIIANGSIVKYIDDRGRFITNFPTSGDTKFIHVRPHAQNRDDSLPLPVQDKFTGKKTFMKHSFWLNSNFVRKIVVEDKYYE